MTFAVHGIAVARGIAIGRAVASVSSGGRFGWTSIAASASSQSGNTCTAQLRKA